MITKMALQIATKGLTEKKLMIKGKNTMKIVKWDDTYFNSSNKYIWIYNCGELESTNYLKSRMYAMTDFTFINNAALAGTLPSKFTDTAK